jgi:hypothetical protein
MKAITQSAVVFAALAFAATLASAGDQTQVGPGNPAAAALAAKSPIVSSARTFLLNQANKLQDANLRNETIDAITNSGTCIKHRANLDPAKRQAILQQLLSAGLVDPNDDQNFPGGLITGVFPPVLSDNSNCPHLPMPFYAAPGSAYHGHHSYPGGLPVHESNNDTADVHLADEYRGIYGYSGTVSHGGLAGLPTIDLNIFKETDEQITARPSATYLDQDIIVGAPLWHDWAKPIVFQWFLDGSEFQELNFGGNGVTDAWGQAGNSKTGGHHIMSVAESMARGLSPAFVITQASAHSNPTSGNEYKVVNWLHAAAIMAQIDPVAAGYLYLDSKNNLRLPPLRKLGDVNQNAAGQVNHLAEYELHNLSDADFTFSGPSINGVEVVLANLAPEFGYDPNDTSNYQNKFRNPVFSYETGERLYIIYSNQGSDGIKAELTKLKGLGII